MNQITSPLNQSGSLKVSRVRNPQQYKSTFEIEEAIDDILKNYKVLILLRGLPGSGKSFLAKCIVEASLGNTNYADHIFSADAYFQRFGKYVYDLNKLSDAHKWAQKNASTKMSKGYSPVIIDNTNTQQWEMAPYVQMAALHGYKIHVLEINTKWCFSAAMLAKKNQHGVSKQKIQAMLDRFERNITPEILLTCYKFTTASQHNPGLRNYPPRNDSFVSSASSSMNSSTVHNHNATNRDLKLPDFLHNRNTPTGAISQCEVSNHIEISDDDDDANVKVDVKTKTFSPEKVDLLSWGTNENYLRSWDIVTQIPDENCDDLIDLTLVDDDDDPKLEVSEKGTDTSIEDYSTGQKILFGRFKDINPPSKRVFVTKSGMLDKGCWTEEDICPDRDEDLRKLSELFQNIPPLYLRDMYDDCKGDLNMAADIFVEDNKDYSLMNQENDSISQPKKTKLDPVESMEEKVSYLEPSNASAGCSFTYNDLQMMLKFATSETETKPITPPIEETSTDVGQAGICVDDLVSFDSDSDLDFDNCVCPIENDAISEDHDVIELNLGHTLIEQLEMEFCDPGCDYPKGFQPVVQIPKAFARQLYAFYVESVYQQMEAQKTVLDKLVKEDEAFARKLFEEENGLAKRLEPEGLKEIMNEQAALNVHEKELSHLKDVEPNDLASQLTRKKLFETFPTVDREVLLDIFNANGRDYKQTVEDLLISVDRNHVVNVTNIKEPPLSQTVLQELEEAHQIFNRVKEVQEEARNSQSYRDEASEYLKNRTGLYQKAQEYYSQGQREVAQFYSQLAQKQTQFYDIANNKAATVLLDEHSQRLQNFDTLDLHYLFVKEAIPALDVFIDRNINLLQGGTKSSQNLLVITGRGNRSKNGVSKIKPAVIGRLRKRNIQFVQLNPGLLKIKVNRNTLPTSDL